MHPSTLRNKLSGVIAFPVTPFKEDLSLDLPGLHENLTKLLEHPIAAVVAAGGTGELYSLTPAEYARVVELTTHAVEDRVPVIAGVGFGQRLAVEMAQAAEKAGADGILAFDPFHEGLSFILPPRLARRSQGNKCVPAVRVLHKHLFATRSALPCQDCRLERPLLEILRV